MRYTHARLRWMSAVVASLATLATGCQSSAPGDREMAELGYSRAGPTDLAQLTDWMTGTFSSAGQAQADPNNYRDIRLRMVRIWPDRAGGPWLYVEQAAAAAPDRPYRQRVYRLALRDDGALESQVYELPGDPLRFAGWHVAPTLFDALSPTDLAKKEGCTVVLRRRGDGVFVGGTQGRACPSSLHGAAYTTSEVTISPDRIVSWDRGFDTDGRQVWGATAGGYVFVKVRS